MDPFDPLSEIINSGQGFYPAIALERILWLIIGLFFLGAVSKSLTRSIKNQEFYTKNPFFDLFKASKNKDESSQPFLDDDK